MKILLTGANGQLGQALRNIIPAKDVIACARKDLNIVDEDAVSEMLKINKPDLLINCAAYNLVDQAEDDFKKANEVNVVGPHNLALASASLGIPIVHVSTDYVFDGTKGSAYDEFDAPNPLSKYGRSKLDGENEVRSCNPRHFVVRTSWLYSKTGQNFPKTMLSFKDREEVNVVNDQVGSPTYVPHLAEAIMKLIETDAYGIYHLAAQGTASWYEFAVLLYKKAGISMKVNPISSDELGRKAKRPAYSVLVTTQTPQILLPSWESGLEEFLK